MFVMLCWAALLDAVTLFLAVVGAVLGVRVALIMTDRMRYAVQSPAADRLALEWSHDAGQEITDAAAILHGWQLSSHTGLPVVSDRWKRAAGTSAPADIVVVPVQVAWAGTAEAYQAYSQHRAHLVLRRELPSLIAKYNAALAGCSRGKQRKRLETKRSITYALLRLCAG